MRRLPPVLVLTAVTLAPMLASCARSRGGAAAESAASAVPTVRRATMQLALGAPSVSATAESFPFTLRLLNSATTPVRLDFTGEPPTPRGIKEKIAIPALWYTIERGDIASGAESVHRRYTVRDTVLGPGLTLEVPVTHSLREIGLAPGTYRIRGGIGEHTSRWETFTVTQ